MVERRSDVNLARPVDARGFFHHFFVIGNPAGHAADGEHHGEHLHRNPQRAHDDAAVEIHVRIQLALDEIGILERSFLEFLGDVEQRIVEIQFGQHFVAGFLDNLRARIVIFVNAVAEAHQLLAPVLILGGVDELRAIVAGLVNVF
jgi:hypothetical protein